MSELSKPELIKSPELIKDSMWGGILHKTKEKNCLKASRKIRALDMEQCHKAVNSISKKKMSSTLRIYDCKEDTGLAIRSLSVFKGY